MAECCMCGDIGITNQLYQCRFCLFRYQHRYCSNLYPETETIGVCNWCLKKSCQENTEYSGSSSNIEAKEKKAEEMKVEERGFDEFQMKSSPIKKPVGRMFKGKMKRYRLLEEVYVCSY